MTDTHKKTNRQTLGDLKSLDRNILGLKILYLFFPIRWCPYFSFQTKLKEPWKKELILKKVSQASIDYEF